MSATASDTILEIRDGVAWFTFNRPQKANALTLAMVQALQQAIQQSTDDHAIRALVLTGAGGRAFSAGADLGSLTDNSAEFRNLRRETFAAVMRALLDFGKPAIAAVDGAACGYGMMLAMGCDQTIATRKARFSLPEINKGTPTLTGITLVSERLNNTLAADLVLSGRWVESDEALRLALVKEIVNDENLMERAQTVALALGKHNATAYAQNKRWLNRELRDALAAASRESAILHP